MTSSLSRRLTAEFLGTAFLVAAVGSGVIGERLANGNVAITLLANTIATEQLSSRSSLHSAQSQERI